MVLEMSSYGTRRRGVFSNALVEVSGGDSDIASVALATLKLVHHALLIYYGWFQFMVLKVTADLLADECCLDLDLDLG